jgi:hypothetical protein
MTPISPSALTQTSDEWNEVETECSFMMEIHPSGAISIHLEEWDSDVDLSELASIARAVKAVFDPPGRTPETSRVDPARPTSVRITYGNSGNTEGTK